MPDYNKDDLIGLRSAIDSVTEARITLEDILNSGTLPNTKRIIRPDGGLRQVDSQLRELAREVELALERQAKVN